MPDKGNDRHGDFLEISVPIPLQQAPASDQRVVFSFKYLHCESEKFSLERCTQEFLHALMQILRHYSEQTLDEFTDQNNRQHRHVLWFPETSEPDGFSHLDPDQLGYHEAWQFAVKVESNWRVHGLLIDNVFYVVWLDPDHRLYPVQFD